jgi:hypothetical protein
MTEDAPTAAVGSPFERPVGRPVPERAIVCSDLACERISRAQAQGSLLDERAAFPQQQALELP